MCARQTHASYQLIIGCVVLVISSGSSMLIYTKNLCYDNDLSLIEHDFQNHSMNSDVVVYIFFLWLSNAHFSMHHIFSMFIQSN